MLSLALTFLRHARGGSQATLIRSPLAHSALPPLVCDHAGPALTPLLGSRSTTAYYLHRAQWCQNVHIPLPQSGTGGPALHRLNAQTAGNEIRDSKTCQKTSRSGLLRPDQLSDCFTLQSRARQHARGEHLHPTASERASTCTQYWVYCMTL